jgi:hypothetical protein
MDPLQHHGRGRFASKLAGVRTLLVGLVLLSGCAAALREKTTPFPPGTRHAVPWELNPELLTAVNRRIEIVVELAAGHPPEEAALDDLARLAARYGERPAAWRPAGAPGTPAATWKKLALAGAAPLRPDTSYVFVRYVGSLLPYWGWSYATRVGGRIVYVVLINQEKHRVWRGVLPERRLEQQTLVHEYGHLLGLPPSAHDYYPRYPDFRDGAHCVWPSCALSRPRPRAVLYGIFNVIFRRRFLDDYCAACRRAIETARAFWRAQQI